MRYLVIILTFSVLFACQSSADKKEKNTEHVAENLDPNVKAIIHYMADSVATCSTWLNQESSVRSFFKDSDTLADFIESKFSHDEIIDFYDELNERRLLNLAPYLSGLKISAIDSITLEMDCIASINNIILLDNNQRALVLFTELRRNAEISQTFLLTRKGQNWHLAEQF